VSTAGSSVLGDGAPMDSSIFRDGSARSKDGRRMTAVQVSLSCPAGWFSGCFVFTLWRVANNSGKRARLVPFNKQVGE